MSVHPEHLGGDRWRVRVYTGTSPTGSPRQISRSFRAANLREARRLAPQIEAELRARASEVKAEAGTIAELAKEWEAHRRRQGDHDADYTRARRQSIIRSIITHLGSIPAKQLTAYDVDVWLGQLRMENIARPGQPERRRSEATVMHYFRVLSAILHQGYKWGRVDQVVTKRATRPRPVKPDIAPPTSDDLYRVLSAAPPFLQFAATFAARTGVRRGELMALRPSDIVGNKLTVQRVVVELAGQPLRIKPFPKGKLPRTITLDPLTLAAVAEHRRLCAQLAADAGSELDPDAYLLPNLEADPTGLTPRRPGWLTLAWRRHCRRLGVDARFHDLRHWHATHLIESGASVTTVSRRLGHSMVSTTQNIYAHVLEESDEAAAAIVAAALPAPPPARSVMTE